MSRLCRPFGIALVAVLFWVPLSQAAAPPQSNIETDLNQGARLARDITLATGAAVSPLLCIGALGAWQYLHGGAEPDGLADLGWYAQPAFWAPALLIVFLLALKDVILQAAPVVKKPFDALEVLENKASALIIAPGVLSILISTVAASLLAGDAGGAAGGDTATGIMQAAVLPFLGADMGLPPALVYGVAALLAIAGFIAVWMVGQVVNLLILLSPFPPLDIALKSLRVWLLALIVGSALINPYLGMAVSLTIVILAVLAFSWTFRFTVWGSVTAWDLLRTLGRRTQEVTAPVRCFAGDCLGRVRKRTMGMAERDGGALVFRYRPWLVGPVKRHVVSEGALFVGKGLVVPSVRRGSGDGEEEVLLLASRYRGGETDVGLVLGLDGVREVGGLRGIKGFWGWLKRMLGRGERGLQ